MRDSESDRDRFALFVASSQTRLLRFAWVLTADWGRAEDLVQGTYLKVWLRWNSLSHENLEMYMRRILINQARTQSRRRWFTEIIGLESTPDRSGPRDTAEESLSRLDLKASLLALPPRQRAVIGLRYFEDLSDLRQRK